MFSEKKATQAVNFFERILTHTKGKWARQPFILPPWQKQIISDIFGTLRSDGTRQYRTVYVEIPKKNGKCLALDTPIPTPDGWTTMGKLKVGDVLFDEKGLQCRVVYATPVMQDKECYAVIFSDGEKIISDADHRWLTLSRKPEAKLKVRTTKQIKDSLRIESPGSAGSNHSLQVSKPIQTEWAELPIHPYVLGAWLGDGTTANAGITCSINDQELLDNIRACGVSVNLVKEKRPSIVYGTLGKRPRNERKGLSIQERLRALGLLGNKHIPKRYLRSSIEQRWALLQGLMDTDGYCSKAGQCEFTTTLPHLKENFLELAWSLGIKATTKVGRSRLNGKDHGQKFRIQFFQFCDSPVFRLKRKLSRQKQRPNKKARSESRQICSVDSVASVPVRCIQVDSPSNLFLVGETFVPTHNTEMGAGLALLMLEIDGEAGAEVYSAASTRDQAGICHRVAAAMVRYNDMLDEDLVSIPSTKVIYKRAEPDSFYKAISADADVQDGINPHCAIFDEIHRQKNRELWDVLKFGMDTREQPLMVALTTAGVIGESPICEELHDYAVQVLRGNFKDPSFYPVLYVMEREEDWTIEGEPAKYSKKGILLSPPTGWYKCNPALGDFLKIESVRESVEEAKKLPSKQSSLRRFRFNQWVNAESIWIPSHEWAACGDPFNANDLAGKTCYGGLDLSSSIDITAFLKLFPVDQDVVILCDFWLPKEGLVERARRDLVPYDLWAAQGLIHLTPGNVIDYDFIQAQIQEQSKVYDIYEIGHDPWNATGVVTKLMDEGFTMVPIRQGFASLNPPTKEWERRILNRTLRHGGHPVLTWMMDCCSVKEDPAGNKKPVKPPRNTSNKRIDGVVAGIMALDRLTRNEGETSGYEQHGIRMV